MSENTAYKCKQAKYVTETYYRLQARASFSVKDWWCHLVNADKCGGAISNNSNKRSGMTLTPSSIFFCMPSPTFMKICPQLFFIILLTKKDQKKQKNMAHT